jgi:hypothetical protein
MRIYIKPPYTDKNVDDSSDDDDDVTRQGMQPKRDPTQSCMVNFQ